MSLFYTERQARVPKLYRSENNGVVAVVRVEDYETARQNTGQGSLVVVPATMVFCADDHSYPVNINTVRTGNLEDYRRLTTGCIVENCWNIFVPFSSFVWGKEWQYQKFMVMSMEYAMTLVHGKPTATKRTFFGQRDNKILLVILLLAITTAFVLGWMEVRSQTRIFHFVALSAIWILVGILTSTVLSRLRRYNEES